MTTSHFMLSLPSRSASKIVIDATTNSIHIDPKTCFGCGACVKACKTIAGQGVLALAPDAKGKKKITVKGGKHLQDTSCVKCGQCTLVCKANAITEKDQIAEVQKILKNPGDKVAVCQTAPAIRINLSDALGLPAGTISTGKMVTALKKLGFKYVFDTNTTADLTIMEEATEFVTRLTKGGVLPMFTSCCPAWINYVEQSHPDFMPNLSSCRSPMGMLSSVIQQDFAVRKNIQGKLFNVAIMPCTAKKDEIERPQLREKGYKETDYVITTRELMRMIKKAKIDFKNLPESEFDDPYAECSGAGAIFCGSGGVMEAAVRTAYYQVTGKNMPNLNLKAVRGVKDGIKFAEVDIEGTKIKVAVAQGIANAAKLLKMIKSKDPKVEGVKFVEVMACPGGCVCGGGSTKAKNKKAIEARLEATYKLDSTNKKRCSHENAQVKALYDRFLEKPNSHKAHELLHTHFVAHPKK